MRKNYKKYTNLLFQPKVLGLLLLLLGCVLYLYGITFVFPVVAVGILAVSLPVPKILSGFLSRLVVGVLVFYGLFQIVASLLFIAVPNARFDSFVVVIAFLLVSILLFGKILIVRSELFAKNDLFAVMVPLIVIIPIGILCFTDGGLERIAAIGGIQGADGANHSAMIAGTGYDERLTYTKGGYYPAGFHLTTAFLQKSSSINQGEQSWSFGAGLYIAQYLSLIVLFCYMTFMLTKQLMKNHFTDVTTLSSLAVSVSLGISLGLFYLLPFIYNGFLSYLYIFASILCAFIFLSEFIFNAEKSKSQRDVFRLDGDNHSFMACYLILIFGASCSWPLLAPPLIATALLTIYPKRAGLLLHFKNYSIFRTVGVSALLVLQLIPIYFQYKYSSFDSTDEINAVGALKDFHYGLFLAGLLLVVAILLSKKVSSGARLAINNIFTPLYLFVGVLAAYQFFTVGELRYYVIKLAILIELLTVVLVTTLVIGKFNEIKHDAIKLFWLSAAVPTLIVMFLIGFNANPLKDTRSLFRAYSKEEKPVYFDQDIRTYVTLGESFKIDMFNSTLLHYQKESQKFYAHMQIPFWANMMQYDANRQESPALHCSSRIYKNLLFGSFSAKEQSELVDQINECASIARDNERTYYIVTDSTSVPYVRAVFSGDNIEVVSQ